MVYRGKPALDDHGILTKQCDRRRPSCTQCLRVNQECSGYRDPNVLRICDQTDEITVKVEGRGTIARKQRKSPSSSKSPSPASILPPPTTIDDQVMSHIFTYYVGTTRVQGLLSYLPHLLSTDPSPALQATMKAAGLESMARINRLPELKRAAGEQYGKALIATNNALRDPVSAKSDSTLGAVILLGMYELNTFPSPMRGWSQHVRGATKLVELRGMEQLNSSTGLELFRLVRLQNLHDLSIEVDDAALADDSIDTLSILVSKALHLDTDLRSWAMSLGPQWQYSVVDTHSNPTSRPQFPLHSDTYHVYKAVGVVSMWNHYRQTRIIIHEMIRSMALRLWGLQGTSECQQIVFDSIDTIKQMTDDICASVPYHFVSGEVTFTAVVRLLWPLFVAGDCASSEPATKEWIVRTLEHIGDTTGIQQALGMAKMLRNGHTRSFIPGT
ncbi:Zn(II)2Cys6 transcription factor [Aspergillus vadensis CBS 113365]|uniref:C6 zinc finger domain protein n=1 Tax=Aspergillus vadensis (strain CBS 113365 / IMI 142717 / IBT 24658) TaxID=1448311 RepID=A0A319B5A9_ASPVC|nr:C6 zinc finger domain protein [Aspergillus vadensis CBS 113365]PYH67976.1 C6 zinc finger domain protein [Aspergillus vadensis CBS 113365]